MEECSKLNITPTTDATQMERQALTLVSNIVPKFKELESLF